MMAEKKEIGILRLFGTDIKVTSVPIVAKTEKKEIGTLRLFKMTELKSRKISKKNSRSPREKFFKLFGVQIPIPSRRRKMNMTQDDVPIIPPQLPVRVGTKIQSMGGTDIFFLTEKIVVLSDTLDHLNRLFIPKTAINRIMKALTDDEKRIIGIREDGTIVATHGANNNRVDGKIDVVVIDGKDNRYDMCMKLWPSLAKWVLNKEWIKFVKENELKTGDSIQIWCFRYEVSRKLGFVVVKNEKQGAQNVGGGSSNVSSIVTAA